MASRSGSQSCTAFVSGVKILSHDLVRNKIRIRSAWTDQTWKMRALSESDPRRLQRAQYQSNWKRMRITALASHSRVKRFYERKSILDFSSSQHPALPHSSSTQHSKRERGIIQRGFSITNVYSELFFLLYDDSDILIKRPFTDFPSPEKEKILRIRDQPRYVALARTELARKREIYAPLCRIGLVRASRKIEFRRVRDQRGATKGDA